MVTIADTKARTVLRMGFPPWDRRISSAGIPDLEAMRVHRVFITLGSEQNVERSTKALTALDWDAFIQCLGRLPALKNVLFLSGSREILIPTMRVAKDSLKRLNASVAVDVFHLDSQTYNLTKVDINNLNRGISQHGLPIHHEIH